ncbi:MAG: response regulator transcription factor [Anaerolineae bacterium]|nr:MAG: response regulator transcription factor [Anaerolineae bacterium]
MNPSPHILVIDDEPQILRALKTILTAHNYRVTIANRGEEGLAQAAAIRPDVIVLDLGLPDMDGIEVCSRLREWTQTPILILSVRDAEKEKVKALDKGADDFLTKPFSTEELLARIRVALRHAARSKGPAEAIIRAGDLTIDLAKYVVKTGDLEVKLTATEYKLLAYLASNEGRVLTHQAILANVWGPEYLDNVEYLRVYINQLRKKLEADPRKPRFLLSEPGIGYRFSSE